MEVDYTKCAFFAADPKTLTLNLAEVDARQAKLRAEREKNAPPVNIDLRKEFNQLRQRLFELQQNAKTYETRCNDAAATVRLLEHRITEALKLKKDAVEAGNLRGERMYEHQVQMLETELTDTKQEFEQYKRYSGMAARALKSFDGHARIEELKLVLDPPLKEKK